MILQEAIKKDKDRLHAAWVAESGNHNGKPLPKEDLKEWKIVIKGEGITLQGVEFGGFQLDPRKTQRPSTF